MEAIATAKNVRISSRKVRLILNLVKGKGINTAFAYLASTHQAAVPFVVNLLKSAVANAEQHFPEVNIDNLKILAAYANEGPTLKRFRPRAMGRGARINKRTSHITLIVGD